MAASRGLGRTVDKHSTSLEDLPDELILQIFTDLTLPEHSRDSLLLLEDMEDVEVFQKVPDCVLDHAHREDILGTLRALSLTSKRMHYIVEPLLYHTFPHPYSENSHRALIRTVLKEPQLGKLVKTVSGRYGLHGHENTAPTEAEKTEWSEVVDRHLGILNPFEEAFNKGSISLEILFLLMLMPNIRQIHLLEGRGSMHLNDRFYPALEIILDNPLQSDINGFRYLDSIALNIGHERLHDALGACLRLPNLRVLELHDVTEREDISEYIRNYFDLKNKTIKELSLIGFCVKPDTIDAVFELFEALEVIQLVYKNGWWGALEIWDFARLSSALKNHRATLKTFKLSVEADYGMTVITLDDYWDGWERLETLNDFSVLTDLHVPDIALRCQHGERQEVKDLGYLLPITIKALTLECWEAHYTLTALNTLVIRHEQEFKELKAISVRDRRPFDDVDVANQSEHLLSGIGVAFSYSRHDPERH